MAVVSVEKVDINSDFARELSATFTTIKKLLPLFPSDQRVACVGCAQGQEVYTLLAANRIAKGDPRLRVDGFDNYSENIRLAQLARFALKAGYSSTQLIFLKRSGIIDSDIVDYGTQIKANEDDQKSANFRVWDLADNPLPEKYPIVFCANMLYHHLNCPETNHPLKTILDNLAQSILEGGFLVCESKVVIDEPGYDLKRYKQTLANHSRFKEVGNAIPFYIRYRNGYKTIDDLAKVYTLK